MSHKKPTNSSDQAIVETYIVDSKTLNNQQRRLLVGGTLTGVAAAVWHKPLINAVVLPTHAQTSEEDVVEEPLSFFGTATIQLLAGKNSILDVLIPQAYAGDNDPAPNPEAMISIVQNEVGGEQYTVSIFLDFAGNGSQLKVAEIILSSVVTVGVQGQLMPVSELCELSIDGGVEGSTVTLMSVDAVMGAMIDATINGGISVSGILLPGQDVLADPMCVPFPDV